MSRIITIGTAVPEYANSQETILKFMQSAYAGKTASRKLNALFHYGGIDTRHSILPDFDSSDHPFNFFADVKQPDICERLDVFKQKAVPLAVKAVKDALHKINRDITSMDFTHLITVTCTGIMAPGLDSMMIKVLNLKEDIFHTALNFLGCNAAFPAMRLADTIAKSNPEARILVICVELCTLHFQPKDNHDNLLSNTIFSDGAAAFIVVPDVVAETESLKGFTLDCFYSCFIQEGEALMSWNITPLNFEMNLDSKVPAFIGEHISDIMRKVSRKISVFPQMANRWAIHPGGKKIIDNIAEELNLPAEKTASSYRILRDFGNMSSPTILFILNDILYDHLETGDTVFSIGFGPGISIDTSWFTYA